MSIPKRFTVFFLWVETVKGKKKLYERKQKDISNIERELKTKRCRVSKEGTIIAMDDVINGFIEEVVLKE